MHIINKINYYYHHKIARWHSSSCAIIKTSVLANDSKWPVFLPPEIQPAVASGDVEAGMKSSLKHIQGSLWNSHTQQQVYYMYSSVHHVHVHQPERVHFTQFYSRISLSPLHSVLLSYHYQDQTVHDTQSYSRSPISLSPLHSVSLSYHYDYQSQTVHDTHITLSLTSVSVHHRLTLTSVLHLSNHLWNLNSSSWHFLLSLFFLFFFGGWVGGGDNVLQFGKRAHKWVPYYY